MRPDLAERSKLKEQTNQFPRAVAFWSQFELLAGIGFAPASVYIGILFSMGLFTQGWRGVQWQSSGQSVRIGNGRQYARLAQADFGGSRLARGRWGSDGRYGAGTLQRVMKHARTVVKERTPFHFAVDAVPGAAVVSC